MNPEVEARVDRLLGILRVLNKNEVDR